MSHRPEDYPLRPLGWSTAWHGGWVVFWLVRLGQNGWQYSVEGGGWLLALVIADAVLLMVMARSFGQVLRARLRTPEQVRADQAREFARLLVRQILRERRRDERRERRAFRRAR